MQESESLREEVKHKLTVEDMRNTFKVVRGNILILYTDCTLN